MLPKFDSKILISQSASGRRFIMLLSGEVDIGCAEHLGNDTHFPAVQHRTHGATAARRIPDPKAGGSNPSGFILTLHLF